MCRYTFSAETLRAAYALRVLERPSERSLIKSVRCVADEPSTCDSYTIWDLDREFCRLGGERSRSTLRIAIPVHTTAVTWKWQRSWNWRRASMGVRST